MSERALIDRLLAAKQQGDPPADELVAAFRALPGGAGWRMLEEAFEHGADRVDGAPAALGALLAPLEAPPDWVDFDLVDAGAVAFWRTGSLALLPALTYGSLAFGYQSAELVRPLAATGRLERMAPRRLGETIRWALDVTGPRGMHVGAPGWRASVRVRMVHALVRDHLLRSGEWDAESWGVPISAAGMLATAIGGFHVVPMRALHDLGVRFSPAEHEAIAHLWRWTGFVMGVPEELLPSSAAQARELIGVGLTLDPGPNEDSPRLMHALLHHGLDLDRLLPGPAARPARTVVAHVGGAFTRRWMGDEMADRLEVPGGRLARLVPLLRPATRARDVATGLLGSDRRLAAFEYALVRRMLALSRAPETPLEPAHAADEPVLKAA